MKRRMKISYFNLISSLLVSIVAILFVLPNMIKINPDSFLPTKTVNLGLDLRGGSHLLLAVDFDNYLPSQYQILLSSIRKEMRASKINYQNLKSDKNNISLALVNSDDIAKAKKVLYSIDKTIETEVENSKIILKFNDDKIRLLKQHVVEQSIEIIRMRIDESGTKEPNLQRQGEDNILLQVPGIEDPSHLKKLLGKTAKLTFHLVNENINVNNSLPLDSLLAFSENNKEAAIVYKKIEITGDSLSDAKVSYNQYGQAVVNLVFNNLGASLFGELTKNNVGKKIAILLDDKLLSAAVVNEPILGGSAVISGNFTVQAASDLALLLRAGSLPAPIKIIEERSVGPNLGSDSIEAGKKAAFVGFVSVVVFMIWVYGILGIFASIALSLSLVYILGLLSAIQATLTLPGIAGIILTIGMAVDANVLIYERIREESKNNNILEAISKGFNRAFISIFDSNLTTIIAALLLYSFGAGAIKGFAVTLSIGIIASMFGALVVTKLLIDIWVYYFKPKSLGI